LNEIVQKLNGQVNFTDNPINTVINSEKHCKVSTKPQNIIEINDKEKPSTKSSPNTILIGQDTYLIRKAIHSNDLMKELKYKQAYIIKKGRCFEGILQPKDIIKIQYRLIGGSRRIIDPKPLEEEKKLKGEYIQKLDQMMVDKMAIKERNAEIKKIGAVKYCDDLMKELIKGNKRNMNSQIPDKKKPIYLQIL
jgi:hypothetical protein